MKVFDDGRHRLLVRVYRDGGLKVVYKMLDIKHKQWLILNPDEAQALRRYLEQNP